MLALMAYLARSQPDDLDEYLRLHLLTWAPHFLDILASAASHPFYQGLAMLAKASLEGIRRLCAWKLFASLLPLAWDPGSQ